MKNLTQKTSRKPKKTKKNNIPGLLEKEKCKNQKNLEKTKKNKKKQYSRTLVCRPHLQTSGILFFLFFLVFSRFFWFLPFFTFPRVLEYCFFCFFWFSRGFFDFCIFPFPRVLEYWLFCFFCFFWFSRGFLDFCIFPFPRVLEYCFFCFFLVFSSLYLIFAFFSFARLMCFFLFFAFFLPRGVFQDVWTIICVVFSRFLHFIGYIPIMFARHASCNTHLLVACGP